jgi:hypothetical protein
MVLVMSIQMDRFARGLTPMIEMVKVFSRILNEVAEFEEVEGRRLDEALNDLLNPKRLAEFSKQIPPDVFGELMAAIMKLAVTMAKTQNFMQLPLDEKRKLASELNEIAISLEKVVEKLRGMREVKLE